MKLGRSISKKKRFRKKAAARFVTNHATEIMRSVVEAAIPLIAQEIHDELEGKKPLNIVLIGRSTALT